MTGLKNESIIPVDKVSTYLKDLDLNWKFGYSIYPARFNSCIFNYLFAISKTAPCFAFTQIIRDLTSFLLHFFVYYYNMMPSFKLEDDLIVRAQKKNRYHR